MGGAERKIDQLLKILRPEVVGCRVSEIGREYREILRQNIIAGVDIDGATRAA